MSRIIWSDKEGTRWQEGYPLGNGRMGAMVYGGMREETVDLSEITFFSGEPSPDRDNRKGAADAFHSMRELVERECYDEAWERASDFIGIRNNYGTNLPVGKLKICMDGGMDTERIGNCGYRRELDLETGVMRVTYGHFGAGVVRRAFLSQPDQVFCHEIASEGTVSGLIRLEGSENGFAVQYEKGVSRFTAKAREMLHSDGQCGVTLSGQMRVWCGDGMLQYGPEGVRFRDCSRVLIGLWMETDFDALAGLGESRGRTQCCGRERLNAEYDRVLERHCADVGKYMKRVTLELGASEPSGCVPVDERIAAVREGTSDPDLAALQFQFGRYLLLASSREDSPLPAHLQGVWNDNVACRIGWTCDMHLDINTQMNYWLSEPGNLSECHRPLFDWMEKLLIPSGRVSARESYGYGGWCADLVSNAWGFSAPYWSRTISPCPTGGLWQAFDYAQAWYHNPDRRFLTEHVWPVLREAAEFFISYVFEAEEGWLIGGPSISPENSFIQNGTPRYFSNGCTYEVVLIRELFRQLQVLFRDLGNDCTEEDRNTVRTVSELLPRLLPLRTAEDGTLAEWKHDCPAADGQHRHTSHLLGLFPFDQITPDKTPQLTGAARESLKRKLTPPEGFEDTGWARALLLLYSARMHEKREALEHILSAQKTLTHPNLLIMHPPTRGAGSFMEVYELDGNTGFSMGVAQMLLQSHGGTIQLLPCLPDEWSHGHVKGLIARGGVEVSMRWENHELTQVLLTGRVSGTFRIIYKDREREISLEAFQETDVDMEEENGKING